MVLPLSRIWQHAKVYAHTCSFAISQQLSPSRNKAPLRNAAGILLSTLVGNLCLTILSSFHLTIQFADNKEPVCWWDIPIRCWKVLRTWKLLKAKSGKNGQKRSLSTTTAGLPYHTSQTTQQLWLVLGQRRAPGNHDHQSLHHEHHPHPHPHDQDRGGVAPGSDGENPDNNGEAESHAWRP